MTHFRRIAAPIFIILLGWADVCAQIPNRTELDALAEKHARASFETLRACLSIPNDAHFPDHVRDNVAWADAEFKKRKFKTTILPTDGPPLLLAERKIDRPAPTVLVYLQIDGQPVDPTKWDQADPYKPALKEKRGGEWKEIPWESLKGKLDPEWRVFARSASDAKGPAVMFLAALDALDGAKLPQRFNLKVVMDFEEELGSPNLPAAVDRHRDALAADMFIIFDGPRHASNRPSLDFGARGIATIRLTTYGPRQPQHSGHYGNYAPNPALRLAQLLASMKDERGRVVIPGFYDDVKLDEKTRALLAEVPDDERAIQAQLGIAETDAVGATLQEAIQYPSLNIRGLASAFVGIQARTLIPDTAVAELDIRLVPENDPERLVNLVRKHVEAQGYFLTKGAPTDEERLKHPKICAFNSSVSYGAYRTPFDSKVGTWLNQAMIRAFGTPPIRIRMAGGSIPISPFVVKLGIPAVAVPTVNKDNNQHAENENIRLGNYVEGVKTFISILTQPIE